MNQILITNPQAKQAIIQLVVDSVDSAHTKRAYRRAVGDFIDWFTSQGASQLNRAIVQRYKAELVASGMGVPSINQRLSAIRKLVQEAADNGALDWQFATTVTSVKGIKQTGQRLGLWLTEDETKQLLNAPDLATLKGRRDRALLSVLVGCGLRRVEVCALTFDHIQKRDGRFMILDLVGKRGRIRSIPMPRFTKRAIDAYTQDADLSEGHIFRSVNRWDQLQYDHLSPQAVRRVVVGYGAKIGHPELAPHDLRRTCAKLMRKKGAKLEEIQTILGHESIETTRRYLGPLDDFDNPLDDLF